MPRRFAALFAWTTLGLAAAAGPAASQPAPGTDIWVAELAEDGGTPSLGSVRRLTDRDGYDNQPHFLPDGRTLLYTSIDATGQADIHRADLTTGETGPFTRTAPESEYSATLTPDGDHVAVIRVEADSTQRLWRFDRSGSNPELLIAGVAPAGYQAWVDEGTVALFVLGDPATLQLVNPTTGEARTVASRIGRSLHRVPGTREISFVQLDESGGGGTIRAVDVDSGSIRDLTPVREGSQDYAWTPAGAILMGQGSALHAWTPARGWSQVADLGPQGLREITRLSVSPDGTRLALVASR